MTRIVVKSLVCLDELAARILEKNPELTRYEQMKVTEMKERGIKHGTKKQRDFIEKLAKKLLGEQQ